MVDETDRFQVMVLSVRHILLLGAGFSYNWGGWLASEAFEYLLGSPVLIDADRDLLWQHKKDGFEAALAVLQKQGGGSPGTALHRMESAIRLMFEDMNRGFGAPGFAMNFIAETGRNSVLEFLAKFDAIFTLNQDLLLEIGYLPQLPQSVNHRWSGFELPGMEPVVTEAVQPHSNRWVGTWRPKNDLKSIAPSNGNTQPLYKLHGSSNWVTDPGENLLVMGGDKTENINGTKILKMYLDEFKRLLIQHRTRLMIVGYGFRDHHINKILNKSAAAGTIRSFIIDPRGIDAPDPYWDRPHRLKGADPEFPIQSALIGSSRRPLSRIFGGDIIERDKVLRFFSEP